MGADGRRVTERPRRDLTTAGAVEEPEVKLVEGEWAYQALQQATKVSYMALEICDDSTKADWEA
jgi:hypothetical protein